MRGVHSAVDDIRRNVFTEVARLAYGGEDYNQVDMIPYKLIPGEVADLRGDLTDPALKVPHMGWNSLHIVKDDPLFKYFRDGEYVYYVHSFYARNCADSTLGTSQYGNVAVTGAVRRGNVWGTQFHPEKSGDAGLRLLRAFAEL